jgi:uncharacterized protein YndB with AHSA1/START domain
METTNFTTTILVDQTPKEVFDAVTDPRKWWSGEFKGATKELGDEFSYRYQNFHYSEQKVTALNHVERVVWLVTESELNFLEDKSEWKGTKIIFEITRKVDKTELKFIHVGIHPEVECYADCSVAWALLIQQSLYQLITTGKTEKPVLA